MGSEENAMGPVRDRGWSRLPRVVCALHRFSQRAIGGLRATESGEPVGRAAFAGRVISERCAARHLHENVGCSE